MLACLNELPERLGMHKIAEPSLVELGDHSPKDPGGVSGFVMIAESHISIHTFPLRGFVSADVYTCQNSLDTERICQYFAEAFGLQDLEINVVRRGTRYPAAQHLRAGAKGGLTTRSRRDAPLWRSTGRKRPSFCTGRSSTSTSRRTTRAH